MRIFHMLLHVFTEANYVLLTYGKFHFKWIETTVYVYVDASNVTLIGVIIYTIIRHNSWWLVINSCTYT